MQSDDPPFLPSGTEVSAKFKGAYCEAKIARAVRSVKCKGEIKVNALVEAPHPEIKALALATIIHVKDSSIYTVVFDDGDERTLKRSQLCLKGAKHFANTENLDTLPLTNPEQFRTPVITSHEASKKTIGSGGDSGSESNEPSSSQQRSSGTSSSPIASHNSGRSTPAAKGTGGRRAKAVPDYGHVVCVYEDKERRRWYPAMVVSPMSLKGTRIRPREEYFVRSFKDGRYIVVPKKSTQKLELEEAKKAEGTPMHKVALEKALAYLENDELPLHWDRELLLREISSSSSSDENDENSDDDDDDEPSEEKDRFVAFLYKFMDERGTPINSAPMIAGLDLNLYKLYTVVGRLGGYNKVCNNNDWKEVLKRMKLEKTNATVWGIKSSYNRYLNSFDSFYRKLGCLMGDFSREPKQRQGHTSSRSVVPVTERTKHDSGSGRSGGAGGAKATTAAGAKSTKDDGVGSKEPPKRKTSGTSVIKRVTNNGSGDEASVSMGSTGDSNANLSPARDKKESDSEQVLPDTSTGDEADSQQRPAAVSRSDAGSGSSGGSGTRRDSGPVVQDPWVQLEKDGDLYVNQMVRVKYGLGSHRKLYKARIQRIESKSNSKRFFVHYFGWNTRYDEYVPRSRIQIWNSSSHDAQRPDKSGTGGNKTASTTSSDGGGGRWSSASTNAEPNGTTGSPEKEAKQASAGKSSSDISTDESGGMFGRGGGASRGSNKRRRHQHQQATVDSTGIAVIDLSNQTRPGSRSGSFGSGKGFAAPSKKRNKQSPADAAPSATSQQSSISGYESDDFSSETDSIASSWATKPSPRFTPNYDMPAVMEEMSGDKFFPPTGASSSSSTRARSSERESMTPTKGHRRSNRIRARTDTPPVNGDQRSEDSPTQELPMGSTSVRSVDDEDGCLARLSPTESLDGEVKPSQPIFADPPECISADPLELEDDGTKSPKLEPELVSSDAPMDTTEPVATKADADSEDPYCVDQPADDLPYSSDYQDVAVDEKEQPTANSTIDVDSNNLFMETDEPSTFGSPWTTPNYPSFPEGEYEGRSPHPSLLSLEEAGFEDGRSPSYEPDDGDGSATPCSSTISTTPGAAFPGSTPSTLPKTTSQQRGIRCRRRRRRAAYMVPTANRKNANRTPKYQQYDSDDEGSNHGVTSGAKDGDQAKDSVAHSSSTAALRSRILQEMAAENPPRPSKYHFADIDDSIQGEERIALILQRISELREAYSGIKSSLGKLDRKRKRAIEKRKEEEKKKEKQKQGTESKAEA